MTDNIEVIFVLFIYIPESKKSEDLQKLVIIFWSLFIQDTKKVKSWLILRSRG